MAGGFLAVSVAPSGVDRLRPAIDGCRPLPTFELDPVWNGLDEPTLAIRTWRRPDHLNSSLERSPASLLASFGSGAESAVSASHGRADATSDPLGYGALFAWTGRGIAAVSTRVEALAQLAAAWGEPLRKNLEIAETMAHIGFATAGTTGFVGVRGVDPDEVVAIHNGALHLSANPEAIEWDRSGRVGSLDDLVEAAAVELTDSVERAVSGDGKLVIDLTAGYDSHLVLGALLHTGAAGDVQFQTVGPSDLHDVTTARARAAQLGLRHRSGFPYAVPSTGLWERFISNARITSGMNNPKDGIREIVAPVAERRVSGLYGELLRGSRGPASRAAPAYKRIGGITRGFGAGRLSLLNAAATERAAKATAAEVIDLRDPERVAWHAAQRFYARARLRSRAARLDDVVPESRHYPLYTKELAEIGLDAMWHHPEAPFADLLLQRLEPALTEPPPPLPEAPAHSPVASDDDATPASLMQFGLAVQRDDRATLMADITDIESDAWQVIDRTAFRAAAAEYRDLSNPQVSVIHGAANAVLWLSDLVDDEVSRA